MPEAALRRSEAILDAVRIAAERLLAGTGSWDDDLDHVLAALGRAADVSRVYVFRVTPGPDGRPRATQLREWVATAGAGPVEACALVELDHATPGWDRWSGILGAGEVLHGPVHAFPAHERPMLTVDGVVAMAAVPIMVGPSWWGFIGFDECVVERDFGPEISAFRAAASTLAAAIQRERTQGELRATFGLLETRVAALSAIAAALTVDQPLESTLAGIAAQAVGAGTAVAGAVQLVDQRTGDLRLVACHGLPDGYAEGIQEAWRLGVVAPSTEALRSQQLTLIHGARAIGYADPRFAPIHPHLDEIEWDTVLVVPLDAAGRNLGAVNLYYRAGEDPAPDEVTFLRAVADQAAAAVENARLYGEARHTAGLAERQRLARELHDSVSQALYGIALGARTARTVADRDPAALAEPLDYVLGLAEAALAEMRALIFELRPESLEQEGLVAALERQVTAARGRHGLTVHAALDAEPPLDLPAKEALYRIAQEALHNVAKHAGASTVWLGLTADEAGGTTLVVRDDGAGFDPDGDHPGHLGLRSMRERAALAGGRLEITSTPGGGSCITATLAPAPARS